MKEVKVVEADTNRSVIRLLVKDPSIADDVKQLVSRKVQAILAL